MSRHEVEFVMPSVMAVAVTRFHVASGELPAMGERMGHAFATVMAELGKASVVPDGPAVARYEPTADGFDVAAGFRVPFEVAVPAGLERLELGGIEAAHATHLGPYSELPAVYEDLMAHADAAGRPVAGDGPMWEEYWSGPETPAEQTRTEVYWPLPPARSGRRGAEDGH